MLKIEYQTKRRDGVAYGFSCSDCGEDKRLECVIPNAVISSGEDEVNNLLTEFCDHHKAAYHSEPEVKAADRVGETF